MAAQGSGPFQLAGVAGYLGRDDVGMALGRFDELPGSVMKIEAGAGILDAALVRSTSSWRRGCDRRGSDHTAQVWHSFFRWAGRSSERSRPAPPKNGSDARPTAIACTSSTAVPEPPSTRRSRSPRTNTMPWKMRAQIASAPPGVSKTRARRIKAARTYPSRCTAKLGNARSVARPRKNQASARGARFEAVSAVS